MQNIISGNSETLRSFRRARDRFVIPPPPTNYTKIFQNEVWNVFNALGRKYTAIPFPDPTSIGHRLIAPPETEAASFAVMKSVIDWLVDNHLAKRGQGLPPKLNDQERPVWDVLTEAGRKAFTELSILDDFEEKFILKFQPIRKIQYE